jgi:hypothetical protein
MRVPEAQAERDRVLDEVNEKLDATGMLSPAMAVVQRWARTGRPFSLNDMRSELAAAGVTGQFASGRRDPAGAEDGPDPEDQRGCVDLVRDTQQEDRRLRRRDRAGRTRSRHRPRPPRPQRTVQHPDHRGHTHPLRGVRVTLLPCTLPAPHPHGTVTNYAGGCRCADSRQAHADRARWRRRQRAYGRLVDKSVPNIGSRRRVEALMCLGWSMREISRRLGWCADRLANLFKSYDGISPANAAKIATLYDELWATPAPRTTKSERLSASRTEALARRRRYRPPMSWDDDTIDQAPPPPVVLAPREPGQLRPHGTPAAYRRHHRNGEKPCDVCLRWRRDDTWRRRLQGRVA